MPATEKSSLSLVPSAPLGIIAGAGMLPRALLQKCIDERIPVAVVALNGFADPAHFAPYLRTSLGLGQGRKILRFFREHQVRDLVLIGAVKRPSFWDIKPDWWTMWRLGPLLLRGSLGDDGLLKAVRRIFENEGFSLRGIQDYLPDLIADEGPMGTMTPDEGALADARRGFAVAKMLGAADVGQSVVVQGGIVLGVEAAEGTSNLIKRCMALKRAGPGPILVKVAKPGQDRALDLPTVGPETVALAQQSGFRGIVVEAGHTLIVDPAEMLAHSDPAGFFIYGMTGQTI